MTRTEIVSVALRLLVLWFFVQALALIVSAGNMPGADTGWDHAAVAIVQIVLLLLVCALTWRFSNLLAKFVLPERDPGESVAAISRQDLERIALRTLGAFVVVFALSGIVYSVGLATVLSSIPGNAGWAQQFGSPEVRGTLGRNLIQLLAGTGLFMGASGLRRVLRVVRGQGDEDASNEVGEAGPDGNDR